MSTTHDDAKKQIKSCLLKIQEQEQQIQNIAKAYIPDYHFLDYAVSNFWTCDKSPIGWCVFKLDDDCRKTYCRYCDGPVERK